MDLTIQKQHLLINYFSANPVNKGECSWGYIVEYGILNKHNRNILVFYTYPSKGEFTLILIKNIKWFNILLTAGMLINLFSYAIGRLQLIPLLTIGSIQILLGAFINAIVFKMNELDE